MSAMKSREIRLAARPVGFPTPECFSLAEIDLPALAEGEVLVENDYLSVDPYMRGRMNEGKSYIAPFEVGRPLEGGAVGRVVASRAAGFAEGDKVLHHLGWRERSVVRGAALQHIDATHVAPQAYLGVLGTTGFTAWIGLRLAELKAGETLFVSAASGAVGSIVGQLGKLRGCHVIGSAGSDEKVSLLTSELGFDAGINYKNGTLLKDLFAAAPKGIDVYFDNVGGDHLRAALIALRPFGRVAVCGMISQYNADRPPPGPDNLVLLVSKRLTLRGFLVFDHEADRPAFLEEVGGYLREGRLKAKETVVQGIDHAVDAFLGLLHGENTGKMLVKLDSPAGV